MSEKYRQFINFHAHSDGSIDGASSPLRIVKRNIELGAAYVTLTEHGNTNTAMDLYNICQKNKVTPILGTELYIELPFDSLNSVDNNKTIKKGYAHLIVHFKDEWAYTYFNKLSVDMDKRAIVIWGERKPLCLIDELKKASGHITIGTACMLGFVGRYLLPERNGGIPRYDLAEAAYVLLRDIAGSGNFFVEIMPHEMTHEWKRPIFDKETKKIIEPSKLVKIESSKFYPDGDLQKPINQFMLDLARKYGDPVVISVDSHFAYPEDKIIQDAKLGNGSDQWKYYNSYHLQTTQEAADILKRTLNVTDDDIHQWVENSYKWASLFDNFYITTSKDRWVLPKLSNDWMIQLKHMIDKYGRMNWSDPNMVNRLKYEIEVLSNNGKINLISYFFNIEDVANFCRNEGILINVRGSGGGSLLLYLIGVSAINPLIYDLSFERFLTLGRIKANTLPDVDIDISDKDRVLDYLREKHGDAFCQISIDSMLKVKSSIKDAERYLKGRVSAETEKLCKSLPAAPQNVKENDFVFGYDNDDGDHIDGLIEVNVKFKEWTERNKDIWDVASQMLNIQRQKSIHACGCIIADKPIQEYSPVITVNDTRATGYSPKSIELAGLVKYDFLRVNTLEDIECAIKSIKDRHNIILDPWHLPYDDKIFDAFCDGQTESVFQFNTSTVIPYLKKIKPRSISDLAAVTALCRPGTLDAPSGDGRTLAEVFVARKNGESVTYVHHDLEPILKETVGIQLYQEQTLKIFMEIAGYSYEKAETVRRGISKKDEVTLRECMGDLRQACLGRGWNDDQVHLLIDQIMASSRYSFNKSHAVSYAIVAYACMYLKFYYKLDWWLSCLKNANKNELSTLFWKYVNSFTLLPDIDKSDMDYIIDNDQIRAPLSILNGLGEKGYAQLMAGRPYSSLRSFVESHFSKGNQTRSAIHTTLAHKLIAAGILDSLFTSYKTLTVEDKIDTFEQIKAEVRQEKKATVPEQYIKMTDLGKYLVKKELIKVYSDDLCPIILPLRGGKLMKNGLWKINNYQVISGRQLSRAREQVQEGLGETYTIGCVAYVIDEKSIVYSNKTKQATKLFLDSSGEFFDDVLWPDWGEDKSLSGFKNLPVLLVYNISMDRLTLKKVIPLINKNQIGQYNML